MTRVSYRRELLTSATLPVAAAMMEGAVAGVVAEKVFHVSSLELAAITAAPSFANLTSFLWARAARGRRKGPAIAAMMAAVLLTTAAIAAMPVNRAGALGVTALVVLARCLLAGVVTVRSVVWRQNYPRHLRGQITGRLATLVSIHHTVIPTAAGFLLDFDPSLFRFVYPASALTAVLGVVQFSKVRVRGERALLDYERSAAARPTGHGEGALIYEYDRKTPSLSILAVLRRDPLFRQYMIWQFFAGVSNMMIEPPLVRAATGLTQDMSGAFVTSLLLTQTIPSLTMLLSVAAWSRYMDRVHIARFRVVQGWMWLGSQVLLWVATVWIEPLGSLAFALTVMALSRLVFGVARGGGILAWNLGHNDFASREMVTLYMGIHVTLTGVRGAFAPFLGMLLYEGWGAGSIAGFSFGPVAGMGGHVFAVSALFSLIALIGFWRLERRITRIDSGRLNP